MPVWELRSASFRGSSFRSYTGTARQRFSSRGVRKRTYTHGRPNLQLSGRPPHPRSPSVVGPRGVFEAPRLYGTCCSQGAMPKHERPSRALCPRRGTMKIVLPHLYIATIAQPAHATPISARFCARTEHRSPTRRLHAGGSVSMHSGGEYNEQSEGMPNVASCFRRASCAKSERRPNIVTR